MRTCMLLLCLLLSCGVARAEEELPLPPAGSWAEYDVAFSVSAVDHPLLHVAGEISVHCTLRVVMVSQTKDSVTLGFVIEGDPGSISLSTKGEVTVRHSQLTALDQEGTTRRRQQMTSYTISGRKETLEGELLEWSELPEEISVLRSDSVPFALLEVKAGRLTVSLVDYGDDSETKDERQ